MTIKELLLQEIDSSPDLLLEETLDFLRFLKTKLASTPPETHTEVSDSQVTTQTDKPIQSTGQSLLKHLKSIGTWEGDDFKDCLEMVYATRGKAKFYYDRNPFDE